MPDGKSSVNPTLGSVGTIDDAGDEIASTSSPVMKYPITYRKFLFTFYPVVALLTWVAEI